MNEQENNNLSKYSGNTSDELLSFLKRNLRTYDVNLRTYDVNLGFGDDPRRFVVVDDKSHYIKSNKKYLVNKIDTEIQERWSYLDDDIRRRTIKKFLDGISL